MVPNNEIDIEVGTATPPSTPPKIKVWQLLLPVVISVGVLAWLMTENFHPDSFKQFRFTFRTCAGIGLALLAWVVQNGVMAKRYQLLANESLSTLAAWRVTLLSEFTSVVTPSAVGGSGVLFIFLNAEGVKTGRATAITLSGLFLDQLFMSLSFGVVMLARRLGYNELFGTIPVLSAGVEVAFMAIGTMLSFWTVLLYIALFKKPAWVGNIIVSVSRLKPLRRWHRAALRTRHDLIVSAQEMTSSHFTFWLRAITLTIVTWCSRYLIAVALIFGFSQASQGYFMAFLRQIVIWLSSLVSPTPGASGVAEYMFQTYYSDFFFSSGIALVAAVIWRCFSSYSYLLLGTPLLMRLVRGRRKATPEQEKAMA